SLRPLTKRQAGPLETLQLFDERGALQVQQPGSLHLVTLRTLERTLDQRQLHAFHVPLEIESFVRKPRLGAVRRCRHRLDLCPEIREFDLRTAVAERERALDNV